MQCTEDTIVTTNACLRDQIRCKPLVDFMSSQTATQIRLSTSELVLECTDTFKRSEGNEEKTVNFESFPISSTLPDWLIGSNRALLFHLYQRGIMKYELMRLRTFETAVSYRAIRMALGTEYTNKLITEDTTREMFREIEMTVHNYTRLAIIINNELFNGDMENRTGTQKDGDKLKELWNNLKFKVMYHINKTAADILQIASDIAQLDHTTYDCVVFCIMTHGGYGVLYGTDCVPLEIQKIVNFFEVAIVQRQQLSQDSSDIDADTRKDIIADEADILICFSTVSGSVSYRCPQNGTWFINSLVKNLRLYSKSYDLQTILVIVNNDVGRNHSQKAAISTNKFLCRSVLYVNLYFLVDDCFI
ncbi:CASP8 [Mytilus edulis]|uniref:CASP8 n=1 Tax=Mytilus edulis TaxID=6550 RepID=A0A8S3RSZ3_MYTED|nr:CASP8 [Mytilus edulis]